MKKTLAIATALTTAFLTFSLAQNASALTNVQSDNGQNFDVQDITDEDDGGINDGGNDAFDDFGMIRIQVSDGNGILTNDQELNGFGLTFDGGRRFNTTTPVTVSGINVTRSLFTPAGTNYMRYIDTFTNTSNSALNLLVAWGGDLGSDSSTTVAATASGDLTIGTNDTWALTIENDGGLFNPAGPANDPPVGYVVGNNSILSSIGDYDSNPFVNSWPGNGNDDLAFVYNLSLQAGQSTSLAYFLYRGLEENITGPLGQQPTTGQEIALAQTVLANLAQNPNFSDLTPQQRGMIANFTTPAATVPEPASTLGLLAVGAIGATSALKRKNKQN